MPSYYLKAREIFAKTLNFTAPYLHTFLSYCLNNTYDYNPHQHVKIWLSSNKDVFLNPLNQLRLVKMRATNPTDTIHFIYDSRLLSPKAVEELTQFCNKHRIIPHNIPEAIIPACKTDLENQLITLYEDEISHLHEGGNLGSASDYLRLLSPIYSLGAYSDFDVHIDSRKLPPTLKVKEPILINYNKESSSFCNDILIITNPKDALAMIQVIQRAMIEASSPKPASDSTFQWKDVLEFISPLCQKQLLETFLALGYSARQFRGFISKIDRGIEDDLSSGAINTAEELLKRLNARQVSKDEVPYHSDYKQFMLRMAVLNSTGPNLYFYAMYDYVKSNLFKIITMHQVCGFQSTYNLDSHFKGQFSNNEDNDLSWVPERRPRIQAQEEEMDKSAKVIQRFFLKNSPKRKEDKVDVSPPKLD